MILDMHGDVREFVRDAILSGQRKQAGNKRCEAIRYRFQTWYEPDMLFGDAGRLKSEIVMEVVMHSLE